MLINHPAMTPNDDTTVLAHVSATYPALVQNLQQLNTSVLAVLNRAGLEANSSNTPSTEATLTGSNKAPDIDKHKKATLMGFTNVHNEEDLPKLYYNCCWLKALMHKGQRLCEA